MSKIPAVFQYLVCNKIKEGLGLSECKHFFSGAAPIMLDTKEFFAGLDMPICEVIFFPHWFTIDAFFEGYLLSSFLAGLRYDRKLWSNHSCFPACMYDEMRRKTVTSYRTRHQKNNLRRRRRSKYFENNHISHWNRILQFWQIFADMLLRTTCFHGLRRRFRKNQRINRYGRKVTYRRFG